MHDESRKYWEARLRDHGTLEGVGCLGRGLPYNRWLYRVRARRFAAVTARLGLPFERCDVLDVGSGTGFYLDRWRRMGVRRLDGLDFTEIAVNRLSERFPDSHIYHADLSDDRGVLPAAAYDVVSAFDVLFHIVDDAAYAAALAAIARTLRPGGVLLYSDNFVHQQRPRSGAYHFSRTVWAIRSALDQAGFDELWRVPMFVLMNAPDDSTHPTWRLWWRLVLSLTRQGELASHTLGAALFPLELALTRLLRDGPSTEIAVCRRRPLCDEERQP